MPLASLQANPNPNANTNTNPNPNNLNPNTNTNPNPNTNPRQRHDPDLRIRRAGHGAARGRGPRLPAVGVHPVQRSLSRLHARDGRGGRDVPGGIAAAEVADQVAVLVAVDLFCFGLIRILKVSRGGEPKVGEP